MTNLNVPADSHETFTHIRIIIGMILGMGVARLVGGATRFMLNRRKEDFYFIHVGWAIFVFLWIIHFWWFEFALLSIEQWTFEAYFLIICYSVVFVALSVMLFPDNCGSKIQTTKLAT